MSQIQYEQQGVLTHPHDGNPRVNPAGSRKGGVREREPLGECSLRVSSGIYTDDSRVMDALEAADMQMPQLPRPSSAPRQQAARPSDALRQISAHLHRAATVEPGKVWGPEIVEADEAEVDSLELQPLSTAAYVTIIGAPGPISEAATISSPSSPSKAKSPERVTDRRHLVIPAGSQRAGAKGGTTTLRGGGIITTDSAGGLQHIFGTAHCNPLACQDAVGEQQQQQCVGGWLPLGGVLGEAQSDVGWRSLKDCLTASRGDGRPVPGGGQPLGEANEDIPVAQNKGLLRASGGGASDHQVRNSGVKA